MYYFFSKKNIIRFLIFIILIFIVLFTFVMCKKNESSKEKVYVKKVSESTEDYKYKDFISEYTSGYISRRSSIIVKFAKSVDLDNPEVSKKNKEVAEGILKITPLIKAKALWKDEKTLLIKPVDILKSNQVFEIEINLKKLFNIEDPDISKFNFVVKTIPLKVDLVIQEVNFYEKNGKKYEKITGVIETSDWEDNKKIEKVLKLNNFPDSVKILWDHSTSSINKHKFIIKDILRKEKSYFVKIEWNGKIIGSKSKDERVIEIYGINQFKYLGYKIENFSGLKVVALKFSIPVDSSQNIKKFIKIKDKKNNEYKFKVENNKIYIIPPLNHNDIIEVNINKNLRSIDGVKFGNNLKIFVAFVIEKPQVKAVIKNGGILPLTNSGYIIPFKAISLKAVDIAVIKIFEKNIVQFFQVNKSITSFKELKRVGRPIFYKTISLENTGKNLYTWNTFYLNFSNFLKLHSGRFYQIRISFRRSQSLYTCEKGEKKEIIDKPYREDWDNPVVNKSYWSYSENVYYSNWEDRNNPCKDAYYNPSRWLKTNILISNLGIIVKGYEEKNIEVYITDLRTTKEISGVNIVAYNFQGIKVGEGKTDVKGHVKISCSQVPFVIVAKKGNERGYLRIDPSTSLSISNFDVGGTELSSGIKGFIYCERGVWRPGDTVYLTFILEDKEGKIPEDHPIIFELRNPRGVLIKRLVKRKSLYGFYNFTFSTKLDDPTGNWNVLIRVGSRVFQKKIKIETIKPNRLKIKFLFDKKYYIRDDREVNVDVSVSWLTGLKAGGLKYSFDMRITSAPTIFKDFPNYIFEDVYKQFESTTKKVAEGTLDENGKAKFSVELSSYRSPGALKLIFFGKVFEKSGNYSIGSNSVLYYPYSSFVGLKLPESDRRGMLLTDKEHTVSIVSIKPDGSPVERKDGIRVKIYKVKWRWWWEKQSSDIDYLGLNSAKLIFDDVISTDKNGRGFFKFKIKYPEWGRFYIQVEDTISGHTAGSYFYVDWPGWAGSAKREELAGESMLLFYAEKKKYIIGETVNVVIPSVSEGKALVSIETGRRVVKSFWIKTKKGENKFSFKATSEMSPTAYISISLIQPYNNTENDLPIRLYGIVPIRVYDPATKLYPQIITSNKFSPNKEIVIKIKEKYGKPMVYTLAIVDEGLLDLTNFTTPSPWDHFYAKEALGVYTWDVYNKVIGKLSGLFEPLITIGGGVRAFRFRKKILKVKRFKPVVKFFGPVFLPAGKTNTHKFKMPNYIGSVKVMLVAGFKGAYGKAEKSVKVIGNVMLLGTLPRVLGISEKFDFPVNVFVYDEKIKSIKLKVSSNKGIKILGKSETTIKINKTGEYFYNFKLKTFSYFGPAKIKVEAFYNGKRMAYWEKEINIRIPSNKQVEYYKTVIKPGEFWQKKIKKIGIKNTNTQMVEITSISPINLKSRLKYLIRYPYGCAEQTVSAVFPQLFIGTFIRLSNDEKYKIQEYINKAIEKLKYFQTENGGFSFWPNQEQSNEWLTNYVGHFLLEAKRKGFDISFEMLNKWTQYQYNKASEWSLYSNDKKLDPGILEMIQAYRLFTLAYANNPNIPAMNRLKNIQNLYPAAKLRLAMAYSIIGQKNVAEELITTEIYGLKDYISSSLTFGTILRDKAMLLESLVYLNKFSDFALSLVKYISEELSSDKILNTQEIAYSLIALSKYYTKNFEKGKNINIIYEINGKSFKIVSNNLIVIKNLEVFEGNLKIINNSNFPVYVRFINSGIPPLTEEKSIDNGLTLNVKYKYLNGEIINDLSNIPQGSDIIIEVKVTNNTKYRNLENVALTIPIATGWEIINTRFLKFDYYSDTSKADYVDIRDDKVNIFFSLKKNETKTFKITVSATFAGKFYLSGIYCEVMYMPEIYSKTAGRFITIIIPHN